MNSILEILFGLLLLLIPIYIWIINFWNMGNSALIFLKGGLIWFVIMIGILFIIIGFSDLKG